MCELRQLRLSLSRRGLVSSEPQPLEPGSSVFESPKFEQRCSNARQCAKTKNSSQVLTHFGDVLVLGAGKKGRGRKGETQQRGAPDEGVFLVHQGQQLDRS
jgi:hypothetical protein